MQRISKLLLTKSHLFVGIIAVICLLAALLGITANINMQDSQPIVANAATTISDATAFANAFKTSGTVSGDFVLGADFNVSSNHISEANFTGTLDGKGHTINILNTHSKDFTNTTNYVGFLFGNLAANSSIKNLNIVLDGKVVANGTNSVETSSNEGANWYDYNTSNSTTTYLGLVAGKADYGAKIENVNISITANGSIAGLGTDSYDDGKHTGGHGTVVGGMIGVSYGAIMKNITLVNNGSIYAKSENKTAGSKTYTYGQSITNWGGITATKTISLSDPTLNERASAGGLIGELKSEASSLDSFVLEGGGYVGAKSFGNGGSLGGTHNINHAGGVVGFANGGTLKINGFLYKYNGLVYVAQVSSNSKYLAGTILGNQTKEGDLIINNTWRNPDEGLSSGYGINISNYTSAPLVKDIKVTNTTILQTSGTLLNVDCQSSEKAITYGTIHQSAIAVKYGNTASSNASGKIVDIKNQFISLDVQTNPAQTYFISSVYYYYNYENFYINHYEKELISHKVFNTDDYSIPVDCTELTVYIATMSSDAMYSYSAGNKQYNGVGISFTGKATEGSTGLLSNLFWSSEHNTDASKNTKGKLGAPTVVTHKDIGTYTISLCKQLSDGTIVKAQTGDNLGPNKLNGPDIIYQYDGSTYTYTITEAIVTLKPIAGAQLSKEYDGTPNVNIDSLIFNTHYAFYRVDNNSMVINDTPDINIGTGVFKDASNNVTSNVGTGLTVIITGFSVTGNFKLVDNTEANTTLTITNCAITKKEITLSWGNKSLTYNGSIVSPEYTVLGTLNNEIVELTTSVYTDTYLRNKVAKTTNAGQTYWAKVEFASESANYRFNGDYIKTDFYVNPIELQIEWESFNADYNHTVQAVNYTIKDYSTIVPVVDQQSFSLKITYFLNEIETSLLNAGQYVAVASINQIDGYYHHINFVINEADIQFGDDENEEITINPISIEVVYYSGSNVNSNTVKDLVYIGKDYINHNDGIHAKIADDYIAYGLKSSHIHLDYSSNEVINVGTYTITTSLIRSSNETENEGIIISNYAISNNEQTFKVIAREISLTILDEQEFVDATTGKITFEYDITLNDEGKHLQIGTINNTANNESVNISSKVYRKSNYDDYITNPDPNKTISSIIAKNVDTYIEVFEVVNNNNYYISSSTKTKDFVIKEFDLSKGNRTSLTPIVGSYAYTGDEIIPTIKTSTFVKLNTSGYYLSHQEHYIISYNNNVNAGNNAEVIVSGIGNFKGSITTTFTINKKVLKVDFSANKTSIFTYSGDLKSIEYTLYDGATEFDYTALKTATTITYNNTPRYVSDLNYVATVSFTAPQNNYILSDLEKDIQFEFKIVPKPIKLIFEKSSPIYTGSVQNVQYDYATSDAIFAGDLVALSATYYSKRTNQIVQPIDADTYELTVTLTGRDAFNYSLTDNVYNEYKISPLDIALSFTNEEYVKQYSAKSLSLTFGTDYSIATDLPQNVQPEKCGIYLSYQPNVDNAPAVDERNLIEVGDYTILAYTNNTNFNLLNSSTNNRIIIKPAELELYVTVLSNTFEYQGKKLPIDIPFGYTAQGGPIGNDENYFSIERYYYNVNTPGILITDCYDVGEYKMIFSIRDLENYTTSKNYIIKNKDSLEDISFSVIPKNISTEFNIADNNIYNAQTIDCITENILKAPVGVLDGDTVEFDIEVIKDGLGDPVNEIRDVGTYTISFKLNESVVNYQLRSSTITSKTYTINPMPISFFANSFSKVYGNMDEAIIQEISGLGDESIFVTFDRNKTDEDNVGPYEFRKESLKIIENGENELIAKNYKISFARQTSEQQHGVFTILPRNIDFNPDGDPSTPEIDPFYFDYLDPITPEKLVYIHKVETAALGLKEIKIQLEAADPSIVNMGTYDLKTSFTTDNNNFVCTMVEGSHLNKIVIRGRSVQITFNDLYITYGDDDPNFYHHIYISDTDILKCDQNIQNAYQEYKDNNGGSAVGFDWSKYILITPEAVSSNLAVGRPYKENGYKLTLEFLNKDNVVDPNYRAVRLITDENGNATTTSETARLYVRKFDLNSVYGDGEGLKKPEVLVEKAYDGKIIANIVNANIDEAHAQQQLTVYADYNSAESGIGNKTITVRYAFKVAEYGNNYILPNDFVYTETATINPLTVEVSIDQKDINLTYGETPSITLSYKGFINNNNINTEGIKLSGIYADGVSLDTIRDVTETSYTIVLKLDTCLTKNYIVSYDDTVSVKFTRKSIALIAGKTYEKAVDGTNSVSLTAENYVLDGLLEQDKNFVHIESNNITAMLNSAEPGETFVRMSITEISGNKSGNYILSNYELTIPAIVKKLADVTLADAEYDFDNTQKPIIPVLENVLDGVKHYLEYTGINVQYATSRQAPKNAGTYKVVCYVQNEDGSYNRAMAEAELVINKITPNLYFTGTFTQTYGSFAPIEAAVKASGLEQKVNVTYSFVEEDGIFPDFPPAGKHTVKAEYDETANYLPISGERTLEIKQKAISITFDNYKGLVYNGYSRENDITVTFNGVVKGDDCTPVKLFSADSVKNAGTYRLIVSPSNPSYMISGSNAIEFTIAKKLLKVTVGNDVVTEAGVAPKFTMQYEGFVENEDESDLEVAPSVRLTTGKVGVNLVDYKEGMDENYTFNYIKCVYTITYASENEGKTNYTPYIATGVAVGSIGLIFLIAYLVKIYNYRSITKYVAKRTIKKAMFKSKNIK